MLCLSRAAFRAARLDFRAPGLACGASACARLGPSEAKTAKVVFKIFMVLLLKAQATLGYSAISGVLSLLSSDSARHSPSILAWGSCTGSNMPFTQ